MSVEILNLRRFTENSQAIDIAFPVLAIECEATPPLENFLDAYEEAVLKFVSLGLSIHGISKTLNATESLIQEILTQLEIKKYLIKEKGKPWHLTEDGMKYLDGSVSERASSESQYGYMFINAIKKEVLPFFFPGDIGKIDLHRGLLPKLTVKGDELITFAPINIKQSKLRNAYRAYYHNLKTAKDYDDGEISKDEAVDLFEDLESFDEEFENAQPEDIKSIDSPENLKRNMFIRALDKKATNLYFRMRLIIDPCCSGGYRVESPFDYAGIDDGYFLRQVRWLEQSDTAYLDGEPLRNSLQREICKISPSYKTAEKDFQVFVLERIPRLKQYRSQIPYVYEDMKRIYVLIQRESSLLEKENIVGDISRYVVEALFNMYFRPIGQNNLLQIQQKAFDDVMSYGYVTYKKQICKNAGLNEDDLRWVSSKYLNTIITRMAQSHGFSIMEKLINMLIVEYHLSNAKMHRFLYQTNIEQKYDLIDKLNQVRRKVSHDTEDRFVNEDYDFYMANVFTLINSLLESFEED